jgi:hypothetical protein
MRHRTCLSRHTQSVSILALKSSKCSSENNADRDFDGDVVVHRAYGDTCRDTDWDVNYYIIPSIVSEFS